jgi:hypothetical protein
MSHPVAKNSNRLRVDMRGLVEALAPLGGDWTSELGRADMGATENIAEDGRPAAGVDDSLDPPSKGVSTSPSGGNVRRLILCVNAVVILLSSLACAQDSGTLAPQRVVKNNTIRSLQLPRGEIAFASDYEYLGGQRFTLYGVAEADQYLFVKKNGKMVDRFYWVQFEHYLPNNSHTYNYKAVRTTDIGGLQFIHDTAAFNDYAGVNSNPVSDGGRARALLAKHGLSFPGKAVRLRMFHLAGSERRSELMIIYGEALPASSAVPTSDDGTSLDDAAPAEARTILDHARSGLTIRVP